MRRCELWAVSSPALALHNQGNGATATFLSLSEARCTRPDWETGLRISPPVPLARSSSGSQIFTTLAAWKGLTRVNHVVTGAGAATKGCLPLHSVSRHDLGEWARALARARAHLRIGSQRDESRQAGRGQWAEEKVGCAIIRGQARLRAHLL